MSDVPTHDPTSPARSRGRPKQMPDQARRREIAARAYDMFRELGYARLTTDAVAARCQISKRTLYQLFPNKAALFVAIIDAHRQRMIALPGDYDDLPLTTALNLIFFNDIDDEADRERFDFLQLVFVESVLNPELGVITDQYGRQATLQLLGDWIERQRTLGRIDVPDAYDAARMLMEMIIGSVIGTRGGRPEWPGSERRRAYVSQCINVFVNGVRAK